MINVILFGTGSGCHKVINNINFNKYNIIVYCDNDENKVSRYINGLKIISPDKIREYNYDYIIVTTMYYKEVEKQLIKLGIRNDIIINYFEYYDFLYDYEFEGRFQKFKKVNEIHTLITGMSHARDGIEESILGKNSFNFALGSQDLYYNYNLFKYLIDNYYEKFSLLKYNVLELPYYIFEYDISLSKRYRHLTLRYLELFEDYHNADYAVISKMLLLKDMIKENITPNLKFIDESVKYSSICNKDKFEINQCAIKLTSLYKHKEYSLTIIENIKILSQYLSIMKSKEIMPVIVVCPTSKYCRKLFPEKFSNQFYSIINSFKSIYKFKVLDFFSNQDFGNEDFYDLIHLNKYGRKKLTKKIEKELY